MVLDDLIHDGQAQPSPYAKAFGRESRIEDPLQILLGNALPGVANLDHDRPIIETGLDENFSPAFNGVTGVHQEIHEDLVDLIRVAPEGGNVS